MTDYDYTFKICMFASKDVGKKTLAKKLHQFDDYVLGEARGVHLLTKTIEVYNEVASLQLWILFESRRSLLEQYPKGSLGFILMYDISNAKSLDWLSEWCQLIKNNLDYDPPILLVGNKLDLEENREVSKEEVAKFKEKHDISSSMEISLKTGENVEKMFMDIVRMILKRLHPEVIEK